MPAVSSSHIVSVDWAPESQGATTGPMEVVFYTGATYTYRGVPKAVYEQVLNAPSVGKALASLVKGTYPYD